MSAASRRRKRQNATEEMRLASRLIVAAKSSGRPQARINLALRLAENDEDDLGDDPLEKWEEEIRAAIIKVRAAREQRQWDARERANRVIGAPDLVRLIQRSTTVVQKGVAFSDLVGGV